MKQLLIETIPFSSTPKQIHESITKNSGRLIVQGPVHRANSLNQNKRNYPKPILEREAKRYTEIEIAQKRALGELDHPDSTVVNLKNVSHNILSLEWKGDELWGTIEILNTPSGNILKELFKSGITVGISSRGMGSVSQLSESGDPDAVEVMEDFSLLCWDFVSDPSVQGAFLKPISESKKNNSIEIKESKINNLIHDIICDMTGACCLKK